jgi:hypothetical protein
MRASSQPARPVSQKSLSSCFDRGNEDAVSRRFYCLVIARCSRHSPIMTLGECAPAAIVSSRFDILVRGGRLLMHDDCCRGSAAPRRVVKTRV